MSERTRLVEHLRTRLPSSWHVPGGDFPEGYVLTRTTVYAVTSRVEPSTLNGAQRVYTVDVVVGVSKQKNADDELDAALEEVLEAIDLVDAYEWTTAERVVLDDKWPAFRVATTVHIRREFPDESGVIQQLTPVPPEEADA